MKSVEFGNGIVLVKTESGAIFVEQQEPKGAMLKIDEAKLFARSIVQAIRSVDANFDPLEDVREKVLTGTK